MKLKKLYMSFICYLTLVAFISVISIEVSYSHIQHQQTEVSSTTNFMNTGLNFVFEENNPTDFIYHSLLSAVVFISIAFVAFSFFDNSTAFFSTKKYTVPLKMSLCISLRTLRI